MPKYNNRFELSLEDMELIEEALRRKKRVLSTNAMKAEQSNSGAGASDEMVRQIHDLLGRLHNQKIFYRPQDGAYVGG